MSMANNREARPAVFIGAGGAGVAVLASLKRKFQRYYGADSPEFAKLQFIGLDTSRQDYQKVQREFGDNFLREGEEWFDLGGFNPATEYSVYKNVVASGKLPTGYE